MKRAKPGENAALALLAAAVIMLITGSTLLVYTIATEGSPQLQAAGATLIVAASFIWAAGAVTLTATEERRIRGAENENPPDYPAGQETKPPAERNR